MNDLKVFDSLAADITLFVAPIKALVVRDADSCQAAIEVSKSIKNYLARVDTKRKELTGPLRAQEKAINDYCRTLTDPLSSMDTHVGAQLNAYAAEQARLVREEAARIERERIAAEQLARVERERAEREMVERQVAEAEALAESVNKWGAENGDVEKVNAEIDARQQREWAEQKAEHDREAALRANEFRQKEYDAKQIGVSNTRAKLKVRVLDVSIIPKEFLIITVNEKALEAVGKTGVKVPGVEFYEDFTVAIGLTTRAPRVG